MSHGVTTEVHGRKHHGLSGVQDLAVRVYMDENAACHLHCLYNAGSLYSMAMDRKLPVSG